MSTQPHLFDYVHVDLPEDCTFKISPSSISKFFEYPVVWYKDQVLGEKQFEGNTSSVLGSVVHGLAELYAKGEPTSTELVDEYLRKYRFNPDVDLQKVKELYPGMSSALINDYIRKNPPTAVEESLVQSIGDGIYMGGTCDNITAAPDNSSAMIVDYKNVSTKPNTRSIPWNYYIQLMAYAMMYQSKSVNVDRIRIVYVVRPTKTLGPRVFKVTKTINQSDFDALDDALTIIKDSVLKCKEDPSLTYLIFKSMQFK